MDEQFLKNNPNMYFTVTSYKNLREFGEELIELLTIFQEKFSSIPGKPLLIDVNKLNYRQSKLKYNEKNVKKFYTMLSKGECVWIDIRAELIEKWHYDAETDTAEYEDNLTDLEYFGFCLQVCCDYRDYYRKNDEKYNHLKFANTFSLQINTTLLNKNQSENVRNDFMQYFRTSFEKLQCITGYVTVEARCIPLTETAFEEFHPNNNYDCLQFLDENIRGYYWGNILTKRHIEKLGGIERIKAEAPCFKIEEINHGTETAVYLQLTENIMEISEDQLSTFKEYLQPLVPQR